MILDEPMEAKLSRPVKISHSGDFITVDTLIFEPPGPQMAREEDKMLRTFNKMQKEVAQFASDAAGPDAVQEAVEKREQNIQAGIPIEALHKEYKDGSPEERAAKIEDIEKDIKAFSGFLDICTEIDFYQMAADFGKMIINNKRCKLKGKDKDSNDVEEMLTITIWEQSIFFKDRLALAIRYCCFFGLTSSIAG